MCISSTRRFLGKEGFAEVGQQVHHWAWRRNGAVSGEGFSWWAKNQMWNLKTFANQAEHTIYGHGKNFLGQPGASIFGQLWYGTPAWPKLFVGSYGGRGLGASLE